ncbi:hypothetical protein DP107_04370 [Haloglomus irregulare]|jgi:hypothetical protein|uniref:Uncharacterized protein n=1 Tax=Haloglomus irregulare TaxID=2234134 RepID=A0A554NCP5_9EURY|nr:hypothetical protein [Haloglomus irregulare]TSD15095.1 hypothetical protein DP107_04370 [Haloglomus irregulare]
MAECERCGDFTDNPADGEYHYCDDCLDEFAAIESNGVIVEEEPDSGAYHVIVTARDSSMDGGSEDSQVDALARGKYIADMDVLCPLVDRLVLRVGCRYPGRPHPAATLSQQRVCMM